MKTTGKRSIGAVKASRGDWGFKAGGGSRKWPHTGGPFNPASGNTRPHPF